MLPAEQAKDDAQKRRYRLLIALEAFLLAVTIAGCAGLTVLHVFWLAVIVIVLCACHLVLVPVCFLYLIGMPIATSQSPEFRRRLRERPALDDEEFYARYYRASDIPKETVVRLRQCLMEFDPLAERAIPSDRLDLLDDESDFAEVLWMIGRDLGIQFTEADYKSIDGSLDNLVREVHRRLNRFPRWLRS